MSGGRKKAKKLIRSKRRKEKEVDAVRVVTVTCADPNIRTVRINFKEGFE